MALQCLSTVVAVVWMTGAVPAQEATVPLPREKPRIAGEANVAGGSGEAADVGEAAAPTSCIGDLEAAGVVVGRPANPRDSGQCVVDDAVVVQAVDTGGGRISLPARPVLECRFAAILADWLSEVVSPVAASVLGSPVDVLVTGPGHQCRNRAGGKLSEHAIGNAIDISGLRLADGRRIRIETLPDSAGAEQAFLRAISTSACGYFTTVLGPGSDAAHADHLHLDVAERSIAEFRICMAR